MNDTGYPEDPAPLPPAPSTGGPLPLPPAPPSAGPPPPHVRTATRVSDRLGLWLALLLASSGLFGAVIAWRLSDADLAAGDAARAGLAATRERSRAVLTAESEVIGSEAAWLRYELAHRRAEGLAKAGQPVEAMRASQEAASHWAFVRSEFIRPDGTYDVAAHRRTTLAQIASGRDLEAEPHFAAAAAAESLKHQLALVGILVAGALPLLAIASVTHRRPRRIAAIAGTAVFAITAVVLAMTWL